MLRCPPPSCHHLLHFLCLWIKRSYHQILQIVILTTSPSLGCSNSGTHLTQVSSSDIWKTWRHSSPRDLKPTPDVEIQASRTSVRHVFQLTSYWINTPEPGIQHQVTQEFLKTSRMQVSRPRVWCPSPFLQSTTNLSAGQRCAVLTSGPQAPMVQLSTCVNGRHFA